MKERFENMTLDQLDAIREVMCYLYPPTLVGVMVSPVLPLSTSS